MKMLFAPLAMKVASGLVLVLLAGNLVLGYMLMSERITSANLRVLAARQAGTIGLLQKSVADMEEAGKQREERLKRAQLQSQSDLEQARKRADRVRDTKPNGCATPPEVLAADL